MFPRHKNSHVGNSNIPKESYEMFPLSKKKKKKWMKILGLWDDRADLLNEKSNDKKDYDWAGPLAW